VRNNRLETAQLDDRLADLARRIREVESDHAPLAPRRIMPTGWQAVDDVLPLGGLSFGAIHECLGVGGPADSVSSIREAWRPCLSFICHLVVHCGLRISDCGLVKRRIEGAKGNLPPFQEGLQGGSAQQSAIRNPQSAIGRIVWIGDTVWPYGPLLASDLHRLLERSLFVTVRNVDERVWAMELCLRSPAVCAVVGDGSALDHVAHRRLQLAAESGAAIGFLARPPWEAGMFSAAVTRWLVSNQPTAGDRPQWMVQLLRCKGMQPTGVSRTWTAQLDHETSALRLFPAMVDRPGEVSQRQERKTG
jgi:hypothetical protein